MLASGQIGPITSTGGAASPGGLLAAKWRRRHGLQFRSRAVPVDRRTTDSPRHGSVQPASNKSGAQTAASVRNSQIPRRRARHRAKPRHESGHCRACHPVSAAPAGPSLLQARGLSFARPALLRQAAAILLWTLPGISGRQISLARPCATALRGRAHHSGLAALRSLPHFRTVAAEFHEAQASMGSANLDSTFPVHIERRRPRVHFARAEDWFDLQPRIPGR